MKIELNIDRENFLVKEGEFCGLPAILVGPNHVGCKWTQANKIFRSSVWSKDGILLSAGFQKFTNWGENPDQFPVPTSLMGTSILNKIDGSLLITDYVNDRFSMRTRGTLSYRQLENATDFEYVMQKYPTVAEFVKNNSNLSVLFEIVSPNCRIVLSYGKEPDIYLVGAVNKDNYSLLTQRRLDEIAAEIKVKRPTRYTADNFNGLFSEITSANDIEGCCVYSNGDQSIHKLKSEHYLTLHRMKSEMGNINRVIDRFFLLGCPGYETFYQDLVKNFDFEIAESNKENVRLVCEAGEKMTERLGWIKSFLADLLTRSSERKFQALEIIRWFTSGLGKKYTSIGFSYLDNKAPQEKILRELLESFIDPNKFEAKSFFSSAAEEE